MARANQKLSFKYFGPFQVLERVGAVAYRLQLPKSSSIHPVVHVSQLKLAAGFKGTVSGPLPSVSLQHRIPLKILGTRIATRGTDQVAQVLVRRSGLPNTLATWEDRAALPQKLPSAAAGGKQRFKGGRMSALPGPLGWAGLTMTAHGEASDPVSRTRRYMARNESEYVHGLRPDIKARLVTERGLSKTITNTSSFSSYCIVLPSFPATLLPSIQFLTELDNIH
jgi:hypothetical protein